MYWFKQRDERHIINQRCRLKTTGYGDLLTRANRGGSYTHPSVHRIRHTHTYVKIPTTNQTKAHLPRWSSLNPQPHRQPPRVVTKPHTENKHYTYLEGGVLQHIPGA